MVKAKGRRRKETNEINNESKEDSRRVEDLG